MSRLKLREHLTGIVLLVCVVAGCKQLQSVVKPTTLKSPDGKFQLTVPAGWREHPSLNDQATIKAANTLKEMYVIVISEQKADFTEETTLDEFTSITRGSMTEKLGTSDVTPPVTLTINGNTARQYEIQGVVSNVKLAYLVTTVESAEHYHQVITWTLRSKIDQNQAEMQNVVASFRPAPGQSGFDPAAPPR